MRRASPPRTNNLFSHNRARLVILKAKSINHHFLFLTLITKQGELRLRFPDNKKTTAIRMAFCNCPGDFHLGGLFKEEPSKILAS